jgi:predicted DsbA family dithiol-disulfide isomerase
MIKYLLAAGLLSSTFSFLALAAEDSSAASTEPVIQIDGAKLTASDLEQKYPGLFFHARNTYYDLQRKAVESKLDDVLLENRAKKEHLTVDQLLDKHVNSMVEKEPSEDALHVYYDGLDTKASFEEVRSQIIETVRQNRLERIKTAYMKSLREEAKISFLLAAPRAPVTLKDNPVRGDVNAPVMIVEYADYECPYCQQDQPYIDKIEAEYKGKVAFVFKDTPLPMHAHAEKAAEAANCAGSQGKYWEYHDLLFQTKQLELAQLKEAARTLKLDGEAFDKCLDSGEKAGLIKENLKDGQKFQLQGTPSFFINGRFFNGGMSYEQLKQVIDEELRGASSAAVNTASR